MTTRSFAKFFFRRLTFVFSSLCLLLSPIACIASSPTTLASGLFGAGNLLVDESNVYWSEEPSSGVAGFPRHIGSISKASNGTAAINYNYTGDLVYSDDAGLAVDNGYLFYVGHSFDGTYYYPSICKVSKTGGSSTVISPVKSISVRSISGMDGSGFAIGPTGGVVYYPTLNKAPNDQDDAFLSIAGFSTQGGSDSILTYSSDGWGSGGNYTISGVTWYYGLAALTHDAAVFPNTFRYCGTKGAVSASTDATHLYWSDGSTIWQQSLIDRTITSPVGARGANVLIKAIATPTTGAAAGSIFWLEEIGGSSTLMRRDSSGQINTVVGPSTDMAFYNKCFAVQDDKVYCGATGGLLEVSIYGGAVTVLAAYSPGLGPIGVAADDTYVYWSLGNRILRLQRPGATLTYTIAASASPSPSGTTGGGGVFNPGNNVTLLATPVAGYSFVNWTEGGIQVSTAASYNFVASAGHNLVANFLQNSTNANLSSLVPGAGALLPGFASGTALYSINLGKSALTFKLTAAVAQVGATVKVNGVDVPSGSASAPATLNIGSNVFTTVVTAPDAVTTKTYTLTVTRSALSAGADMNNDGNADLLFQNSIGQIAAWYMNGSGATTSAATLYGAGLGDWRIVGKADMNGDGKLDIIFQNNVGQIAVWYLNGSGSVTGSAILYGSGLGDWRVKAAVDMNGDGNTDIVFEDNVGQIAVWYMNGSGGVSSSATLYGAGLGDWRVVAAADMNNDGNPDLIFQNNIGQIAVWYLNGTGTVTSSATLYGAGLGDWRIMAVADMNGDGNADIIFQNNVGQIAVWYMNGSGGVSSSALLYSGGLGDWRVR